MMRFKLQFKKRILFSYIFMILLSIAACGGGDSAGNEGGGTPTSATLNWTAVTTNSDSSLLTDLVGYKIYIGLSSGSYSSSFYVGDVLTYTVSGLTTGTKYYAVVTAWDSYGNESNFSNEISKTL